MAKLRFIASTPTETKKPGGAYNAGVEVRATEGGRTWQWSIDKPGSRNENLKAAKISEAGENR